MKNTSTQLKSAGFYTEELYAKNFNRLFAMNR